MRSNELTSNQMNINNLNALRDDGKRQRSGPGKARRRRQYSAYGKAAQRRQEAFAGGLAG